jgi:hypothetical protein
MGLERWFCGAFGGTGKIFKTTAAASLIVILSVATSRAGDISSQPADSLSVTNSVTRLLPQAAPPPGGEQTWLSRLHISGYGSQTFGMWQNPTALKEYTRSRNNLAVARSLLQLDVNYRFNENNTFFTRAWFVYEPPYSFNSANNPAFGAASANHASFGHFMNGYYNNYQFRDAWWENKFGPLTTFVGNQLVVWGQSLAFRVGDVINPADTCWAFGFANLEQSRNPLWMVHPILNLPEWGPLTSNFAEVVWIPGVAPVYWPEQDGPAGLWDGQSSKSGRTAICQPSAHHGPSARFDVQHNNFFRAGIGPGVTAPFDNILIPAAGGPASGLFTGPFSDYNDEGIVAQPANREFWVCTNLAPLLLGFNPKKANFADPVPPSLRHPCHTHLSKGNVPYSVIGDGTAVDIGRLRINGFQPQNWNVGVRLHTLYGSTEWTLLYYDDNTNGLGTGTEETLKWTPYTNLWEYHQANVQQVGVTVDRPLPMPAMLAEYFPAVFRGEMLYLNHMSVEDQAPLNFTGQGWSDRVRYMLALDLDQAYAPWLTSTGNLSANLEVEQEIIMDNKKTYSNGNALAEHQLKNDVSVLFNFGTSWWWSDFAPTWTMIWNPKGDTFALFPSIILNPPWTKKYFMKLQAIEILGGDKLWGIGLFKGQSYLIAQFQYNFNVM